MANLTSNDPKPAWFHENILIVRNNEAILDEVPFTVRGGETGYSASDGGFFTYRARFAEEQGKPIATMRLSKADYAVLVVSKDPKQTRSGAVRTSF